MVACSDDTQDKTVDGGVDGTAVVDQKVVLDQADTPDKGPASDRANTPDQKVAADVKVGSDRGIPKVLTSKHKGWKKTQCSDSLCHGPLPVKKHTETNDAVCARCHGGNGACDPTKSKASHTKFMTCVGGCHGSKKHNFSKTSDCISCHFAAAGLDAC